MLTFLNIWPLWECWQRCNFILVMVMTFFVMSNQNYRSRFDFKVIPEVCVFGEVQTGGSFSGPPLITQQERACSFLINVMFRELNPRLSQKQSTCDLIKYFHILSLSLHTHTQTQPFFHQRSYYMLISICAYEIKLD